MGFLKTVKEKFKKPKPDDPRDLISADDDEFESISVMSSVSSISLTSDPVPDEVKCLSYYHGFPPRQDAEDMVIKVGDFLVRRTEVKGDPNKQKTWVIIITIRADTSGPQQVDHIAIPWSETKQAWECGEQNDFKKLDDFINKYMKAQRSIMDDDNRYKLKHPIPRHNWEMRHAQVVKQKQVGHGAYGEVWKGFVRIDDERFLTCAIKCLPKGMISTPTARQEFIKEANVCRLLQHENIVKFRGIAIDEEPIMMLFEWCVNGSLLDVLKIKGTQLTLADRTRFCVEAAQGLRYLEKNKIIHRDVAARNCLLNADMTVKMADFGLSQATRFYKETKAETKLPIRWLAPESLGQNIFSSKTDVWSYGVLMNETSIYTNGETPYPSLSLQDVRTLVTRSGGRLAAPAIMQPGVAALMKKCFEENPNERPTFLELKLKFRKEYAALTKKPGGLISFFKHK